MKNKGNDKMNDNYREAFAEISEILKLMPSKMQEKIPKEFKQIIEKEKSKDIKVKIEEPIEECILKEETIILLALIYRDFLCDKEERDNLKLRDSKKLEEFESEIREKYNPDQLFKKRERNQNNISNTKEEFTSLPVEIKKDSIYIKIINIIKKLFKKE